VGVAVPVAVSFAVGFPVPVAFAGGALALMVVGCGVVRAGTARLVLRLAGLPRWGVVVADGQPRRHVGPASARLVQMPERQTVCVLQVA
jgi:hypothetical protein